MITITTDKRVLNCEMIHSFLTKTYWAKGRTIDEVQRTIANSVCFGVFHDTIQIGFARVVTDCTVFAYIMDVFILPAYRGNGYSKQLLKRILADPNLKPCTVWMLKTSDAHALYNHFGFTELAHPEIVMEKIIECI